MNLYKCGLTIYVIAESEQRAQVIASHNAQEECWSNWQAKQVIDYVTGLWGNCLPYIGDDYDGDDLTCNEFLERKDNE